MAFAILRVQKLKGASVSASDQHTERERETPNADKNKLQDNIRLIGEPNEKVRDLVDKEINAAGGKPRKDSVECVEFLMTASPEYFCSPTKKIEFAEKSMEYMSLLEDRGFKFVKAVMHVDETTPHIAAYAVPFDPNGKLNAKYHLGGNRWRLSEYQDEFAEVMEPLGLERGIKGSNANHQQIQKYYGQLDLFDQTQKALETAQQNEEQVRQLLQKNTELLQQQLENRSDLKLFDVAKAFISSNRLEETSQGLAILQNNDSSQIKAIITADNKAFGITGEKLSDGSSVMFIEKVFDVNTDKALNAIESKFDKESEQRAARAYGEELANRHSKDDKRDFSDSEQEIKEKQILEKQIENEQINRLVLTR